jgi:hypothetical protein
MKRVLIPSCNGRRGFDEVASVRFVCLGTCGSHGRQRARVFRAATRPAKEHQYEAARLAFAQAYELDPLPGTLLNLGLAELIAKRTGASRQRARTANPKATPIDVLEGGAGSPRQARRRDA